MAKSMEQLEIAKTPPPMRQKIRRDAVGDGYRPGVLFSWFLDFSNFLETKDLTSPKRPRSAHFVLDDNIMDDSMGCVSPIRSLWKSLWEDDPTNKRPLYAISEVIFY